MREDSVNLGAAGKCVRVKAGYARNHLIPSRLAVLATPANRAVYERKQDEGAVDTQATREAEAALQASRKAHQLEIVMKRLLTGAVVLQRELAPDLEPPTMWNEKERLLTKLLHPVTRAEICAAITKQKRVHVAEGLLEVEGGVVRETGDFLIPLRMVDPEGKKPGFMLSILPIQPIDADADDDVAAA
ncbi:hypothetical protein WJX81_006556 [Elliptochloris bilobata]|uniref:Large ribosomal subunit protein bL9c n=1 Tax=Elliptochloris bilobata TaxID=381761 RepID=A0AAW1SIP9_9CHLO